MLVALMIANSRFQRWYGNVHAQFRGWTVPETCKAMGASMPVVFQCPTFENAPNQTFTQWNHWTKTVTFRFYSWSSSLQLAEVGKTKLAVSILLLKQVKYSWRKSSDFWNAREQTAWLDGFSVTTLNKDSSIFQCHEKKRTNDTCAKFQQNNLT